MYSVDGGYRAINPLTGQSLEDPRREHALREAFSKQFGIVAEETVAVNGMTESKQQLKTPRKKATPKAKKTADIENPNQADFKSGGYGAVQNGAIGTGDDVFGGGGYITDTIPIVNDTGCGNTYFDNHNYNQKLHLDTEPIGHAKQHSRQTVGFAMTFPPEQYGANTVDFTNQHSGITPIFNNFGFENAQLSQYSSQTSSFDESLQGSHTMEVIPSIEQGDLGNYGFDNKWDPAAYEQPMVGDEFANVDSIVQLDGPYF